MSLLFGVRQARSTYYRDLHVKKELMEVSPCRVFFRIIPMSFLFASQKPTREIRLMHSLPV